jgi:hypothetical protein
MPYCFTILTILHIGSLTPGETTDYGDIALHSAILVFRSVLSPVITLNQNIIALLSYLYQLRLRHRRSAVFINCASNAFSGSEHLLSHLRPQHFLAHSTVTRSFCVKVCLCLYGLICNDPVLHLSYVWD